jgi:two-component system cell cycle sensor histidine kinase/response regulator CckA
MGIARDTTTQHELAEQLETQNLLLNSVINASPVGILLFDAASGTCDIANPAVGGLGAVGLTAGARLADGWPGAAAQLGPILGQAQQSKSLVQTDIDLPGARRVTVIALRIQLPQRGSRVLVMLTEVTERIQLQEQLLQAQKMEAIGRLAGGIAHDFNNLLTPILGYSELLLRTLEAGDPRREDVEEVCRAAKSAGALTRQLLTFSRKQISEPVVLNLNSVMDDLDKLLRRSIGEDIDVVQQHQSDLGSIRADRNQLEQVVMNLSVNARDAMPQGGTLTIATANRMLAEGGTGWKGRIPPGDYVVLSVTDVGTGIAPEVLSHLFEPFFTTKAFGEGTGLGLSTVYGIVAGSGGYIAVQTALGEGTVFNIYLPRVDVDAAPDAESPRRIEALPTGDETISSSKTTTPLDT